MPYVNIRITREGGTTPAQKAELIRGVTELLVSVLDKSPATTFVVIDEVEMEDWGVAGLPVEAYRKRVKSGGGTCGNRAKVAKHYHSHISH